MKQYIVKVTEIKKYYTCIDAENPEEAKRLALKEYQTPNDTWWIGSNIETEIMQEKSLSDNGGK